MKIDTFEWVLFVIAAFVIGFVIGGGNVNEDFIKQAIQHGYMQHNPVTGKSEWLIINPLKQYQIDMGLTNKLL